MTELNDGKPRQIKIVNKYEFTIGNVSGYSPYTTGGYFTQVKMPVKMSFVSKFFSNFNLHFRNLLKKI